MSIARSFFTIIAAASVVVCGACDEAPTPATPVLRLTLPHPAELVIGSGPAYPFGLALAPDGRRVVFPAAETSGDVGRIQLWVRDLAADTLQVLGGTDGAMLPFWSPDGQSVAFFAAGKLRTLALSDGDVQDLADAPSPFGGDWDASGTIVFAPRADAALMRRTADGRLEPFTTLAPGESGHRFPRLAPDGHVVFFVRSQQPTRQGIWIASGTAEKRQRLVNSDAQGLIAGTSLLYASGDALVAQPIDFERLTMTGRPQLLGSPVGRGSEHQLFATIGGDVLLFGMPQSPLRELRWVDRTGAMVDTVGELMNATDVRVSPDGARVAVARVDPQLRTLDIWTYADRRPVPRRLSPAIDADESPAWTRDGRRIAWVSGRRVVTVRDAGGERPESPLRTFEHPVRVSDWSPDARWIVVSETRGNTGADITLIAAQSPPQQAGADRDTRPYAQTPFNELHGVVSPDGRWLAYASDESGRFDIYVDSFPTPTRRARLTVGGGTEPRWARDGRSLFFRSGSAVHVVHLAAGAAEAIATERLFDTSADIRSFDVSPDNQRFLLNVAAPATAPAAMKALVHVRTLLPSAP